MGSHIPSWAEEIVLLNINEIVTIPAKNLFIFTLWLRVLWQPRPKWTVRSNIHYKVSIKGQEPSGHCPPLKFLQDSPTLL